MTLLELRHWLPPSLTPWTYEGVTIYGSISDDRLDEGTWEDDSAGFPLLRQLMLVDRLATSREYAGNRQEVEQELLGDEHEGGQDGLPTARAILAALDEPRLLFAVDFGGGPLSGDEYYPYYLLFLSDADLHILLLEDNNSGYDMLGFIDGRADLAGAKTGAIGLLKDWFSEERAVGVPWQVQFGLLDRAATEAILRSSPYFSAAEWEAQLASEADESEDDGT